MSQTYTPEQIAEWMLTELDRKGELDQETAVFDIERRFGSSFVYETRAATQRFRSRYLMLFAS